MEFRILGPLQGVRRRPAARAGGAKQRAVLAHLILRANLTVAPSTWSTACGGRAARNTLQTYVYRLRKVLGEERLEGRDGGYVLTAEPEEVDAARFEAIGRTACMAACVHEVSAGARPAGPGLVSPWTLDRSVLSDNRWAHPLPDPR